MSAFFQNDDFIMDQVNGADAPGDPTTTEVLTLGYAGGVSGIVSGADHDWYRVNLVAGQTYGFITQWYDGTNPNPTLTLHDASGVAVPGEFNDNIASGETDAYITYTPTASGVFYVDVGQSGASGSTDYDLFMGQALNQPDQVAGNTSTTATITVGGSASGVLESFFDEDWFGIHLTAGQSYLFTLNASGSPALEDPYLEIYGSDGKLITFNDDAGDPSGATTHNTNSALRYTPTTSGTYYLSAEAFSIQTGGYQLTATAVPPQDPLKTIDWGTKLASTSVAIYFAHAGETWLGETASQDWSSDQIAAAMAATTTYSAFTNLTFTQVSNASQATWVMVLAPLGSGVLGEMDTPPASGLGPLAGVINPTYFTGGEMTSGGLGFATILHEMGHGLGLAHPHDNGGTSELMEGVTSAFDSYGSAGLDQGVFTVMTYNDGYPSLPGGAPTTYTSGYEASPMALDIGVLQQKYGAIAHNTGDDTYTLQAVNGRYLSIWDTGGNDTLSAAGIGASVIVDLRPATLLNQDGGGGYVSRYASLNAVEGGYTIAAGVTIENAIGGSGNDILTGNTAANHFTGGLGNDTIDGGSNVDTAIFSSPMSAYAITHNANDSATVSGPDGTDTLTNVETFQFADQSIHFFPGVGTAVNFSAAPSTFMGAIRDFDGNDLGSASGWQSIGTVDIQGDGTAEHIYVNSQNGRWADVGTAPDGLVYFDDHGWAGDTRVVGIYIDPLVQNGTVTLGGPFDSQRRFQNDLNINNIHGILGAGDYNHDGLQEVYFSLTDGTAYLHAYMHADGNIEYANYQSEQQVIDYLTSEGYNSNTWSSWFPDHGAQHADLLAQ